jgi:hypothetical protein
MNVVVESIASFRPRFSLIITDMDAADLDPSDDSFGRVRVCAEAADVGFVTVAGESPLLARRQLLQASQLAPRFTVVTGDVEVSRMHASIQLLVIETLEDGVDLTPGSAQVGPCRAAVGRAEQLRLGGCEDRAAEPAYPHNPLGVKDAHRIVDLIFRGAVDALVRTNQEHRHPPSGVGPFSTGHPAFSSRPEPPTLISPREIPLISISVSPSGISVIEPLWSFCTQDHR